MRPRVLATQVLNRTALDRQLLLSRRRLSVPDALERVGGIQTQYAPSGYIGLWSRIEAFERDRLTRALVAGRALQGTLMRMTIHMVSATDFPLFSEGVRRSRREWWLRVSKSRHLDAYPYDEMAEILTEALSDGPRPRSELVEALVAAGFPKEVWEGAGLWVDMIRVPPSGTWEKRRADLYGLAPQTPTVTEQAGLGHLATRYLRAFGPATVADISSWSGVPQSTIAPVVDGMSLRRFRDEDEGELIDLPRLRIVDAGVPAPVRLLPHWDALLLVHARRKAILPEELRTEIFNSKNPFSVGTFLVDGVVAGTWRLEGNRVSSEVLTPIHKDARRQLDDEVAALEAFAAD
ncbi:MAG: winged helix DNA-binding domain-containing protein [Acidimicrobiia bacterium]